MNNLNRNMLPKTIAGRYELSKQEIFAGQSSSKKGVYVDKKTESLVFIKLDTNIKPLSREYAYQQFFYEQSKKLKTTNVIVPKPLELIEGDNYIALVMEYFPAKSLLKTEVKTHLDAYMKVLKFLEKINTNSHVGKKYGLTQKSAIHQLLTLPYFLSKNLMNYLPYASLFLSSTSTIFQMAPQLLKLTSSWISHGDINVGNVLLYRKKVILCDFALSYQSHRYFDISRVLNSAWYKKKLHDKFWARIVKELGLNQKQQDILKSFVIINLLERLSQRYVNRNQERFYLKRLETMLASFKNNHLKQLLYLLQLYGYQPASPIKNDEHARANGIISDGLGKKYFIKAAFGKNSYEYKSLFRESQITRYLSTLTNKINLTHNGYRLNIPPVAKIIDQDEILCLITRFVEGKKLLKENSQTQGHILTTTLELVSKLSSQAHMSSIRPYLKNYTREAILLSLPLRFLKAAFLSPFATGGLIKAFSKTLSLFHKNDYQCGLVHPDINLSNLILQKKSIYLTDWEETGWGMNVYNAITPVCVHWQDQILRNMLLQRLQENGQKKITIPLLAFRTLMLFNQNIERDNKRRKRDFMLLKFLGNTKLLKI